MNANDLMLGYAAFGASWGAIAALKQIREFRDVVYGGDDLTEFSKGDAQLEELMRKTRYFMSQLNPALVVIAVTVVGAMLFVSHGLT